MATHGTLETIFVMVVPLVFWFLVLANLPAIIGGILGMALAIVTFPFLMAFLAFRDRHIFRENKRKRQNQKSNSQQQYKPEEENQPVHLGGANHGGKPYISVNSAAINPINVPIERNSNLLFGFTKLSTKNKKTII